MQLSTGRTACKRVDDDDDDDLVGYTSGEKASQLLTLDFNKTDQPITSSNNILLVERQFVVIIVVV
jgi:hypothetical protein